jgi:hypothetical protein
MLLQNAERRGRMRRVQQSRCCCGSNRNKLTRSKQLQKSVCYDTPTISILVRSLLRGKLGSKIAFNCGCGFFGQNPCTDMDSKCPNSPKAAHDMSLKPLKGKNPKILRVSLLTEL